MSTPHWLHHARTTLLDFLFPPRCGGCGRSGQWFCDQCVAALAYLKPPLCLHCGQEMHGQRECRACRRHPLPAALSGVRALAHHEGSLRRAIHALKYERLSAIAEPLGGLLCHYLESNPFPFTLIMPVPLHAERQAERGYNQSALLAAAVSRRSGQPINASALTRQRNTPPQVGLNESERRKNLIDAFQCSVRLDGQQVLLIDDVCTTGATMMECASALHAAGAASVWGLTLAR